MNQHDGDGAGVLSSTEELLNLLGVGGGPRTIQRLEKPMSVIAKAIVDRQSEIERLQAEIRALNDVDKILGISAPAKPAARRSSSRRTAAAATPVAGNPTHGEASSSPRRAPARTRGDRSRGAGPAGFGRLRPSTAEKKGGI